MEEQLKDLSLVDLISEKHIVLRRMIEERWSASEEEAISHTEALLLAKIHMGKISLAEVARQANISRQAMYKCAKQLEERGYLVFTSDEAKAKYTVPTEKGKAYYQKSQELKEQVEMELSEVIGKDTIERLKNILRKDWQVKERK